MKRLAAYGGLLLLLSCGAGPAPKAEALPPPKPSSDVAKPLPDPEPWRLQRPAPGQAAAFHFPTAEQATLPSGLTILTLRKSVPVASIALVFRHGAAACPPGQSGLAAITARMLTEGTKKHPGVKLAAAIEQLGTVLDEETGRDTSSLSLSVLTADLDEAFDLLGEVVQEPAFAAADFERVQKEWLDGLRAERQAPERLASLAGMRALLGKPHGSPVSGSAADVQKLTLTHVSDFHRKAYGAGDAALIVVGDVDLASVKKSAERAFKKMGKGQKGLEQAFSPPPAPPAKQVLLVDRPGAVQSALFLAQPLPKRSEPGYEQRELLTTLLGGLFTSRLNLNLREEHAYTYGARAKAVSSVHSGLLYVATSVRTDVTAEALKEAVKELRMVRDPKLGKPLNVEEIGRAKADLVQSLGARLEHGARIGSTLAELWLYRLPPDYYQKYPQILAGENADTLTKSAAIIDPERMVMVVVGDRKTVEAPLQALGYQVLPAPAELLE